MNPSKTAHIIGGGPSARLIPFKELVDTGTVIGVNDSYFNAPCEWVVSIDGRWMLHRWKRLKEASAKAWLRVTSFEKHVGNDKAWPNLILGDCNVGGVGVGDGLHHLYGNNSGLVALNFAYFQGFERIFLYGFDMGFEGKKHWYEEYAWSAKGNTMYPAFCRQFDDVANFLKSKNIQVWNVSPSSKLECFERINYGTAKDHFR